MNQPIITAHSGCEDSDIDSMRSVEIALELGADAVEIDVRVDRKGDLRISHDIVSQEEYENKLTLRQVFECVYDTDILINCDLKEQAALYKTLEEAEKFGIPADRLILSGCTSPEQLARDIFLFDRARFFLNIEEVLKFIWLRKNSVFRIDQFVGLMKNPWMFIIKEGMETLGSCVSETIRCYQLLHANAVNLPKTLLGSMLAQELRKAEIPLSVWTVDEPELVQACLTDKVFNITTGNVAQALQMRDDYNKGV